MDASPGQDRPRGRYASAIICVAFVTASSVTDKARAPMDSTESGIRVMVTSALATHLSQLLDTTNGREPSGMTNLRIDVRDPVTDGDPLHEHDLAHAAGGDPCAELTRYAAPAVMRPGTVRFLVALVPWLSRLSVEVRALLVAFAVNPTPMRTVDLAKRHCMSRRSLDRAMTGAGLRGAACFMKVANFARLWDVFAAPKASVASSAKALGYKRLKTFQHHSRVFFGSSAGRLSGAMSAEEFAERLAGHARRHAAAAPKARTSDRS